MKIFVASDIHSYFSIFKQALDDAGYDYKNKDHMLILCGDCFDRGDESQEMLDFLNAHTERTIIVAGNHRDLMYSMLDLGFYQNNDIHNGTVKTVLNLAGYKDRRITYWGIEGFTSDDWENACKIAREKLDPIYKRTVNYYQTAHYIFTHSWIPITYKIDETKKIQGMPPEYWPRVKAYDPNWETAEEWIWKDEARWCNPFQMAALDLNKTGKTIVSGHWNSSYGHAIDEYKRNSDVDFEDLQWGPDANHNIYYGDGIIGIDSTCALSHKINILVLEDELLEDIENV